MSFFDTKQMGDLLQRMADHSRVQSFLTSQTLNILFAAISFIIYAIVLYVFNWAILLIFIIGSLLYGCWIAAFLRKRKAIDYELFEAMTVNQNKTYQFLTCMQEIKLQSCEKRRRWEWEDVQADLFVIQMKSLKLQQTQDAGGIFINEIKNIIITVFAATAVIQGDMTLGAMLAIQYIIGQISSSVDQFMSFANSVQDVKISLERINEIHREDNEQEKAELRHSLPQETGIIFSDVTFSYDRYSPVPTIDGISMNIPRGKVTAIVGTSGCGKTTLIKLMLGYYPIIKGEITVGGFGLPEYDLKWWRSQCGVVMQDGVIFSESIVRNIAVDDNEIDIERMRQAAEIAGISDFVSELPLKYNTIIGNDGLGLSQGQKQRILIARAVYKNPDFIFLDEATNSLDATTERTIVDNLNHFFKGRTVVIVAHRLSTVRNADQIIVIEKGRIVETGSHETLIARRKAYFNLIKDQLELGL